MRRLASFTRFLAVVPVLVATHGAFAQAAAPAMPAAVSTCLAPLSNDDPDVVLREVKFFSNADHNAIGVKMCIASRSAMPLAMISGIVGILKKDGTLLNSGGSMYLQVPLLTGAAADLSDKPKMILLFATDVSVDPKDANDLLDRAIVQVEWAPCKSADGTCEKGTSHTATFLAPVSLSAAAATH